MMVAKKAMVLVAVFLMLITCVAVCGAAEKPVKIGISMDALDSGFWIANLNAMRDEAKKLNVEIVEVMADSNANKQNDQVAQLVARGCTAIIIAAHDGAAIASAVADAQKNGVPCIMDNRGIQSDTVKPAMQVLSDNELLAYEQVKWFGAKAKAAGEKYNILVLIGATSDENANERFRGHKKAIAEYSDNLFITTEVPTDWKIDQCLSGVQNAMSAYPDISCIISPSDSQIAPISSALTQINRWKKRGEEGHMMLLTLDGDAGGMGALAEGYSDSCAVQQCDYQGRMCIQYAVKLSKGEEIGKDLDLDPGLVVTYENLDEMKDKVWSWPEVVAAGKGQ